MRRGTVAGFVAGALGLTLLEAFLAGPTAGNATGLLATVASGVQRVLDPTVPAIPDRQAEAPPASSSGPFPIVPSGSTGGPNVAPLPPIQLAAPRIPSTVSV